MLLRQRAPGKLKACRGRQGDQYLRQALPSSLQGRDRSQSCRRQALRDPYEHADGGCHLLYGRALRRDHRQ